jgi:hypothetical protein
MFKSIINSELIIPIVFTILLFLNYVVNSISGMLFIIGVIVILNYNNMIIIELQTKGLK